MLKRLPKYLFLFLITCCVKNVAQAQAVADSLDAEQTTVYTNVEHDFYKKIGPQSRLYNGMQYDLYNPHMKGNAYYENMIAVHNLIKEGKPVTEAAMGGIECGKCHY